MPEKIRPKWSSAKSIPEAARLRSLVSILGLDGSAEADWEAALCPARKLKDIEAKEVKKNLVISRVTRDRCYDYLNIFAKKFGEKIGVFDSKQS
jgi:hypothetical protein